MYYLVGKNSKYYKIYDSEANAIEFLPFDYVHMCLDNGIEIKGFHRGIRGYYCRIFPDDGQKIQIERTIGCCRKLYNEMLADSIRHYEETGEWLTLDETIYKNKYSYMNEVDSQALVQKRMDLENAFHNYFSSLSGERKGTKVGYPKFKAKYINKRSYRSCAVKDNKGQYNIRLEGIGKHRKLIMPYFNPSKRSKGTHKALSIVITEPINGIIKNVTITHTNIDEYYASICCECWIGVVVSDAEIHNKLETIGIDGGVKTHLTIDNGVEFTKFRVEDDNKYNKKLEIYQRKLKEVQRKLSYKTKGSNNWVRQKRVIAKYYKRISRLRQDFRHNVTCKLSSNSDLICIENLGIKGMMSNPKHSEREKPKNRGFGEVALYETYRQLGYKQDWHNHRIVKVGRTFASSQLCCVCGFKYKAVAENNLRIWTCPSCGSWHDRDENASRNIRLEGIRLAM